MIDCYHAFDKVIPHYRICVDCGETQKEVKKVVQPQQEEWVWTRVPFSQWKREVEGRLKRDEKHPEALEWYKALKLGIRRP